MREESGGSGLFEGVPRDVIEDLEAGSPRGREKRRRSQPGRRPTRKELDLLVVKAINYHLPEHPSRFVQVVRELLREEGYDENTVTDKRIWESYERVVRKKWARDHLGVTRG
ncbi:MAG: hypothetical protein LRS43_00045 [Desulfurococcales archaeon]|nr:hypothetical protein [Desulfurococcales archaeon]